MKSLLVVVAAFPLALTPPEPWKLQVSGTTARLRGVSVAGRSIGWASGSRGTCLLTTDFGTTWKMVAPPDSAGLDFRDVQGFDAWRACLLSIGPDDLSRIYRTADGGATWTLQHTNRDPKGFLDAIAFWDPDHGLALGDPVDGRFVILATDDGGKTWSRVGDSGMPAALPGEGAFAASGTCLVTQGASDAWFGTGGGSRARVFRSTDRGRTWAVADTPIRAGIPSAGVFSLAFRDADHGVAVGGDYKSVDDPIGNVALTADGGKTWTVPEATRPAGFRSAVASRGGSMFVAVGPSGSDVTFDDGLSWRKSGALGFHAFDFRWLGPGSSGWAVGEDGRIAIFDPGRNQ